MSIYSILFNTGKSIKTACDFSFLSSKQKDRREQKQYITMDRRTGTDRRDIPRFNLDPKISNDISNIKNIYASIPHSKELIDAINKRDSFVKQNKDNLNTQEEIATCSLSSVPFFRRAFAVKQAHDDNDDWKAYGKLAILLNFLFEDGRDFKASLEQIVNKIKGVGSTIPKEFQIPFSYTRGTLSAHLINKMGKLGDMIYSSDKTLYSLKLSAKLLDKLGLASEDILRTSVKDIKGNYVDAIKLEGKPLAVLIGRAMLRTPVQGIYILSALELAAIYKAFTKPDKTKDRLTKGSKQIAKSIVNVSSMIIFTSLLGALGASKAGATGSLIGLGVGAYSSTKVSNQINRLIDAA